MFAVALMTRFLALRQRGGPKACTDSAQRETAGPSAVGRVPTRRQVGAQDAFGVSPSVAVLSR